MADALFMGYSVPSQPNSGIAAIDVDAPLQSVIIDRTVGYGTAAELVKVTSAVVAADGTTTLTFSAPVVLDPGTITNSSAKVKVGTLTASGYTLIQGITRFLRRLSKLNRGAN